MKVCKIHGQTDPVLSSRIAMEEKYHPLQKERHSNRSKQQIARCEICGDVLVDATIEGVKYE